MAVTGRGGREGGVLRGTTTPCPVAPSPLGRCPPGRGRSELELRLAAEGAVCTATGRMVHRLATATGVAVHHHKGGDALWEATQTRLCLLFFTFFTTFANVLTLQVFYYHVQVC